MLSHPLLLRVTACVDTCEQKGAFSCHGHGQREMERNGACILKRRELVKDVDHTMQLEAQGVGDLDAKIVEMADDLAKNPNSKLWD